VTDVTLAYRKSVLDAVLGSLTSLRAKVGAADKVRLDKHADNVRGIEARLTAGTTTMPTAAACKLPASPGAFADQNGQEQMAAKMKAMSDLLAIVLACNQTRVFSMMFTGSTASTIFSEAAVNSPHHQLTHDEPGEQPLVQQSTVYTMQMFGTMLASLKATPEGAGNVLDNCAILASTDTSDGRFHNLFDYPILVAGKAGGFLKYPGIHYRSTVGGENTSTVFAQRAPRRRHEAESGRRGPRPRHVELRRDRSLTGPVTARARSGHVRGQGFAPCLIQALIVSSSVVVRLCVEPIWGIRIAAAVDHDLVLVERDLDPQEAVVRNRRGTTRRLDASREDARLREGVRDRRRRHERGVGPVGAGLCLRRVAGLALGGDEGRDVLRVGRRQDGRSAPVRRGGSGRAGAAAAAARAARARRAALAALPRRQGLRRRGPRARTPRSRRRPGPAT